MCFMEHAACSGVAKVEQRTTGQGRSVWTPSGWKPWRLLRLSRLTVLDWRGAVR